MLIDMQDVNSDKVFFTADNHFGHANIIKFCHRPFADANEMDDAMIANWNSVVPTDGVVYHLGDFTLSTAATAQYYFGQLNGKVKILSNPWHHDRRWLGGPLCETRAGFVELLPPMVVLEIPLNGEYPKAITLCHYPIGEWDRKHYGAWHLHGHSHGAYRGYMSGEAIVDIGVDVWNFKPVSFDAIGEYMTALGY